MFTVAVLFFRKEVFVIEISPVSVWPVGFGILYFPEGEVLFCDVVFVVFDFLLLCFWNEIFVIGISRVPVWSNGLGGVLRRVFVVFACLLLFY